MRCLAAALNRNEHGIQKNRAGGFFDRLNREAAQ